MLIEMNRFMIPVTKYLAKKGEKRLTRSGERRGKGAAALARTLVPRRKRRG
jgi:hypothetical protein